MHVLTAINNHPLFQSWIGDLIKTIFAGLVAGLLLALVLLAIQDLGYLVQHSTSAPVVVGGHAAPVSTWVTQFMNPFADDNPLGATPGV
jgi:hypothetical protein